MVTNTATTVRDIVIENPAAARVFEAFHIDYCCGGRKALGEACEKAGVDAEIVLDLLNGAPEPDAGAAAEERWSKAPLGELTRYIVERHHSFVRAEAPRLQKLFEKVVSRHGAAHPELAEIQANFDDLAEELHSHMLKEERVLFPYIEALARSERPEACFGSVMGPISVMTAEHEDAGLLLKQMRELSGGYVTPQNACPTYRALYHDLNEFEQDLHRHIHLENNVLFPRAEELAK